MHALTVFQENSIMRNVESNWVQPGGVDVSVASVARAYKVKRETLVTAKAKRQRCKKDFPYGKPLIRDFGNMPYLVVLLRVRVAVKAFVQMWGILFLKTYRTRA